LPLAAAAKETRSTIVEGTPRRERKYAVAVPWMPPPRMTTFRGSAALCFFFWDALSEVVVAPEALTRTTPTLGEVFAAPVHREERCIELGSTGRHENVAIEGRGRRHEH